MNRKCLSFVSLAVMALALEGCSVNGSFYPVKGPLASQTPVPMYIVRFTAHPPTSLTVSGSIANEQVSGILIRTLPAPKKAPTLSVPAPMTSQWDSVYGPGAYNAHVLGTGQDARGVLTGSSGTTFQVEIHTPQPANSAGSNNGVVHIEGVAEDNKGNLYKVAF